MLYPLRLLPQSGYQNINVPELIKSDYYFISHVVTEDFLDENGLIREEYIEKQCHNFHRGISTCLYGIFTQEDTKISINRDGTNYYQFIGKWDGKTKCSPLVFPTDFDTDDNRGFFLLKLSQLHNLELPEEEGVAIRGQYKIRCQLVHDPTNCNFWHFLIRWDIYDLDGNIVEIKSDKKKKRILTTARDQLINIALLNDNDIKKDIDEKFYK